MRITELTESGYAGKKWARIAQQNVDNHLGDVVDDPSDEDSIYDNVVALAYDAVIDAGGMHSDAQAAAEEISINYHPRR